MVIPYEMWIFNRALEGIKETVLLCPGESAEGGEKKKEDITQHNRG